MSSQNTKSARSPSIDQQAKQITYNVYNYYKKRKLDKTTLEHQDDVNVIELVSEVTGIKSGTVRNVIKQGNAMKYEHGFVVFRPKVKRPRRKKITVDKVTEGIIRRKVIKLPQLKKLNALLKKENILQCSREFLRLFLFKLGFSVENYPGLPCILIESADILSERMSYLQAVKDHRDQGRSMFHLSSTKNWECAENNSKDMTSFVMVHTSGPGFIDNVQLMLKLQPTTADDECFEHFENYDWMKDAVLPNIPPNSVVIIDLQQNDTLEDRTYVEKPTTDSPQSALEEWLNHHNIPFEDTASKSELMELIKSQEAKMEFSVTKLIKESGHHLLYLPQNHSDLSPIAIMWHNVKENIDDTSAYNLFTTFPKKQWEECILQVKENEAEYYAYGLEVNDQDYIPNLRRKNRKNVKVYSDPSDSGNENSSMDCY